MRKFIKYSFISLIIAVGIIIPLNSDFSYSSVLAADCTGLSEPQLSVCISDNLTEENTRAGLDLPADDGTIITQDINTANATQAAGGTTCNWWSATFFGAIANNLMGKESFSFIDCVLPPIVTAILTIASWILWFSGLFLDYATSFTLNLSETAKGLKIGEAWGAIRDLVNITFIFGLLYIAIQTILGLDEGNSKKFLASIIIAAIFINFSLFFTKVIIDASNIVAIQFYSSITDSKIGSTRISQATSISTQFMDRVKLHGIYNDQGGFIKEATKAANYVTVGIFGSIFTLIAAVVFFFAGILLIVRSAILIFLMVTSPIGFVGAWLPKLKTYSDQWWSALFDQALVAPVFFMLIWLILKITEPVTAGLITEAAGTTATANFAQVLTGKSDAFGIVINFVFLIALLIAALNQAKELSGKMGATGAKLLGTAVGGAGGWLGRQTAGRVFARLAGSEKLKSAAEELGPDGKPTAGARRAMLRLKTYEGVAKSSFDIRSARAPGALGDLTGGIIKGAGIDTGTMGRGAGVGGFRKAEQDAIRERAKMQENDAKLLETKAPPGSTPEEVMVAKQVTARRQQAFAQQLRTPPKFAGVVLTRPFTTSVKGDIEAAGKIEKSARDTKKLEEDIETLQADLKKVLEETLEREIRTEEITVENIERAIEKLETASAEAKVRGEDTTVSVEIRARNIALQKTLDRKAKRLESIPEQLDKKRERLDKTRGADKKGDKKPDTPSPNENTEAGKTTT